MAPLRRFRDLRSASSAAACPASARGRSLSAVATVTLSCSRPKTAGAGRGRTIVGAQGTAEYGRLALILASLPASLISSETNEFNRGSSDSKPIGVLRCVGRRSLVSMPRSSSFVSRLVARSTFRLPFTRSALRHQTTGSTIFQDRQVWINAATVVS